MNPSQVPWCPGPHPMVTLQFTRHLFTFFPRGCIVYRHALANADGVVAFGSTTGNLHVSEDRGETWVTVGNNFPPIYSVRFG